MGQLVIAKGYGISFWADENTLKLIVVIVAQLCEYTNHHWIVYFKWANFLLCELYLKTVAKKKRQVTDKKMKIQEAAIQAYYLEIWKEKPK